MTACCKERKLPYEGGQFRTFLLGRELPVLSVSGCYLSGRSCSFPQHWMQEICAASPAFGLPPGKACSFSAFGLCTGCMTGLPSQQNLQRIFFISLALRFLLSELWNFKTSGTKTWSLWLSEDSPWWQESSACQPRARALVPWEERGLPDAAPCIVFLAIAWGLMLCSNSHLPYSVFLSFTSE